MPFDPSLCSVLYCGERDDGAVLVAAEDNEHGEADYLVLVVGTVGPTGYVSLELAGRFTDPRHQRRVYEQLLESDHGRLPPCCTRAPVAEKNDWPACASQEHGLHR